GGAGIAIAYNQDKPLFDFDSWSWGTAQWLAGGASYAQLGAGAAFTLDIAFSPEARHVRDLAGPFVELGASYRFPALGVGLTGSIGLDKEGNYKGITLWTGSFGAATPGFEAHAFYGHMWIQDWDWYKRGW
ncbi:MAG: hypothetical protein JSV82_01945, partial [Planctomycetota bacterium]